MALRVGINGFGRIGRSVFRILSDRDDIEVVAINDLFDNEQLAYLLKYDTVMGVLDRDVSVEGDAMYVDGERIAMTDADGSGGDPLGGSRGRLRRRGDRGVPQPRAAREAPGGGRQEGHPDRAAQGRDRRHDRDRRQRRGSEAASTGSSPTPRARPTAWRRSPRSSTTPSASRRAS